MKIEIKRLELTNFKCFRHKEIIFDSSITTIRGRNGVGKTTIADAILWTLFGKNTQGQADFDLKTHDADGKPIPNLDHSVEMVLRVLSGSAAEKEITLKRTLKETWVKKRASEELVFKNNTTEYLVDGDATTAADYKKFIASLVNEDVFKAITSPTYFPSLKWQMQREFLTKMVGYITPEEIATTDELAEFVRNSPESNKEEGIDIIAIRKHLSYQIKQIKDKLDKIPVRLEEQNKALPELLDFDALQTELDKAQKQIEEVNQKMIAIRSGNGGDVLRAEIRVEMENIHRDMHTIEEKERFAYRVRQSEHDNRVTELSRKFNQLITTQRDLESQISSFEMLAKRCQETLDQCERDAQDIRNRWSENQSRSFLWEDGDSVCPTCGQYLPEEQLREKQDKARQTFNENKAEVKRLLTERANKVKATRADTEAQIADIEAKKAEAGKHMADTKEEINSVFSEKAKAEKEPVLSFEEALAGNTEHQNLLASLTEAQKKLESVGISEDDTKEIERLEALRTECNEISSRCQSQLATRDMRLKVLALIDGINKEQRDLVRQLSELERHEDVARRYQDRQNAILEERINAHFSLVKWRMFRTVNNGGEPFDEPFCECYVGGVAYHDGLNQAARLNAGLDIINTLCKHYNVSAPIVLDNAESTINILPTTGQQVRLEVADTDLQTL